MEFSQMLGYLSDLELHNNRTWFHETHARYEKVRRDFEEFTTELVKAAAEAAPSMAARMLQLQPKQFIYRTARDMRYAAGKPPYKTWFACALSDEGREKTAMSFYVQISPQNRSEICVGVWFTDNRKTTEKIRRYIAANADRFAAIMADEQIKEWFCGDKLIRPPKGFSADEPMIEYIKHKQWMLACSIPDKALTDMDSVVSHCKTVFLKMEPFRAFFEEALRSTPEAPPETEDPAEAPESSPIFWPTAKSAEEWDF